MKVALVGPSVLSDYDKTEIQDFLHALLLKNYDISILSYRSVELEVFKYFVQYIDEKKQQIHQLKHTSEPKSEHEIETLLEEINMEDKLTIYTFQNKNDLTKTIKSPIQYLEANGATYVSLESENLLIKRSEYADAWRKIISECDMVISFYNEELSNENAKLMIPIDIALQMRKQAFVYHLPSNNLEKYMLPAEKKMELKISSL